MSDIWIKETTGTSSTAWKRAVSLFVKTTTGTTSAAWKAATSVYVYFSSGWTRVWPLSGVFSITSPYIATSSGSTTPLYGVDGARRVGSVVFGKNGTWNANGWVINSYQYRWRAYNSSEINDLNRDSQTSLATYSSAVSLTIPATYDRKYLSFFIKANSSGGSAYDGFAESGTEYGGLQIVRQQPLNISASLSNIAPQVGNTISFSSSWNITEAYAPEAGRTSIEWYKNLSNSTTGGTFLSSGSYSYTVQSSDLNYYIYAVETTFNSGTDYDLGLNTGVSVSRITTSVVSPGLTAPTSTSIVSVSRLNSTQTRAIVSSSGGSGPYYQLYWTSAATAPTSTANYDAASTTSTVTEDYEFSNGITYYFYIRSSSENLGNTTTNGTSTSGTYSAYGPTTGAASYAFAQPSGTVSVSPSSGTAGTTTFTATPSVSASPSAQVSYQWQYYEGGSFGWLAISNATSSTYAPPSNYVSVYGTNLRCQITANNGVGTQLVTTAAVTVAAAVVAPYNGSVSVSPSSGTAGSTTFTATPSGWLGTPSTFTYSYSWQRFTNGLFIYQELGTGSTFSPTASQNSSALAWVVVLTVSNGVSPNGSAAASFTVNAPVSKLATPTGLSATTNRTDGINISWNAVSGAAYYGVWYRGGAPSYDSNPDFGGPNNPNLITGTSYLDTSIGAGVTRSYDVQAFQSGNPTGTKSEYGGPVTGTRANVVITQYTISWNANGGSVSPGSNTVNSGTTVSAPTPTRSGYTFLYWRDSPSAFSYIYQINPGGSWTVTSNITFYAYWQQNTVVPSTPTGVTLTGSGAVSWNAVSGADYYEVLNYTDRTGSPTNTNNRLGPYNTISYSTSLQLGSSQGYSSPNNWARVRVRAWNNSGQVSAYSAWVPSSTTYT